MRAIFSGHYHTYHFKIKDGIRYINLTSSGNMPYEKNHLAGRSHNFLFITVSGDSVSIAVVNKNNIYSEIRRSPTDEYVRSQKYFSSDQTAIITNPALKEIDTTLVIPVRNNSDKKREFRLAWETENEKWKFDPALERVEVDPEETDSVKFHIACTERKF